MAWEHYEISSTCVSTVIVDDHVENWACEMGVVTTGRQRVFSRWFVSVRLPDGSCGSGEHRDGPVQALRCLDDAFRLLDLRLLAAGLDTRFYESGLSTQSSWGYIDGEARAYHMMEVPPPRHSDPAEDAVIDAIITEAVAGIGCSLRSRYSRSVKKSA